MKTSLEQEDISAIASVIISRLDPLLSLSGRAPLLSPRLPETGSGLKPQTVDIEAVVKQALTRYDAGRNEHGQLDLATDRRDFLREAEQELLDCINYCVFQIIRLRGIKR